MKVSAERGQPASWAAGFLDTHIYDALPSFALTQHFRVHFIKGSAASSDVDRDCDATEFHFEEAAKALYHTRKWVRAGGEGTGSIGLFDLCK